MIDELVRCTYLGRARTQPRRAPPPPPPLVLIGHAASFTPVLIGHAGGLMRPRPPEPFMVLGLVMFRI